MRKSTLLLFCFLSMCYFSFAQLKEITGKITDAKDSAPIIGAIVKGKGTKSSALTQTDGSYSIKLDAKVKVLVVSYLGYTDVEAPITGLNINVALSQSSQSLNEVVVVGYGTKLKRDVTGSITKVGSKEIANTPTTSFESAIQGRASGVLVSQQNGKVGQGINIRIRGSSSVNAGNEPLYVIDGIPVVSGDLSSNGAATDALADLNMNDIETLDILKDASAAAIYGSQGSNGVVMITTKKGKAGTSKIEAGYFTGTQKPTRKMEFLNSKQYVDYFTQAAKGAANQDFLAGYYNTLDEAVADYTSYVESRFTRYSAGTDDWKTGKVNTNWQDQAFQTAPISQYDLNFSGGNDKTKFYLSGQFLDQKGILVANSYNRYSTRLNLDHQVKSWLNIGMNLSYAKSRNYRVANDDAFSTPLQIIALSPITPVIDPRTGLASGALNNSTGNPNTNYPVYYNPLLNVINAFYHTNVNRTLGNVYGNVILAKGLTFRTEFGIDQLNQTEEAYYGKLTARNSGVPNGSGFFGLTQVLRYTTNNYFNFKKSFNNIHDIDFVAGMAYQQSNTDDASASGEQFPSDSYKKIFNAASKTGASSDATSNTLVSYFARANYKYADKYILGVSTRMDGSSRFGKNNKYGFFPAVSAGWIINEENFLKSVSWLNLLKLKGSIGLTGNDRIADFASRGLYGNGAYGGLAGQKPVQIANPDLKWESTLGTDVGIEASVLNNRVTVEVAYYTRKTRDLLLFVDIPATSGFLSQFRNIGNMTNKGVEFTLNTTNINTKNFRWTSSFNIAFNQNKITNLQGQVIGSSYNKAREGQPLGVFYAREFAGADPANGDALYYKNTKKDDGSIDRSKTNDYNAAEDVRIGNPNPKFFYGFSNTVSYKGIDLDVLLQGISGNDVYLGGGQYMSASGSNGFDNQTLDQLKAWKKPGDITNVPEARLWYSNGTNPSSRYITSGTYLRVKAISLGYNLPKSVTAKLKLERVRLYVRGQNLFTITKYKAWDPEVNADYQANNINQGVDFYSAPQAKSIVFGLNIGL